MAVLFPRHRAHVGALTESSSLIVGPGDLLAHLRSTDAAAATLDATFSHCAGLSSDQHAAWTNLHADYAAFSAKKKDVWGSAVLNVLTIGIVQQAQLRDDEAKTTDFENQFRDWAAIAKAKCGLNAPVLPSPNEDPKQTTAKTLEHVAIAGAVIVAGGAFIYGLSFIKRLFP